MFAASEAFCGYLFMGLFVAVGIFALSARANAASSDDST
jgi:hypothetical protein